jgi:hypothetical protein
MQVEECSQEILASTISKLRTIPSLKDPLKEAEFTTHLGTDGKIDLVISLPSLGAYQEVAKLAPILSQQLLKSSSFSQIQFNLINSPNFKALIYPVMETSNSIIIAETERRDRTAKNWNFLLGTPGILALHSAHANQDFAYLALKCEIPERLCKMPEQLLRRGLSVVPPELEEIRRFYLEKAVSGGSTVEYTYEHIWRTLTWRFQVHLIPLGEEVLAITQDNDGVHPWQANWWKHEFKPDGVDRNDNPRIFPETQNPSQ